MATLYFQNTGFLDGKWETTANWWLNQSYSTPAGRIPNSSDDVVINGGTIYIGSSGGSFYCRNLDIYNNCTLGSDISGDIGLTVSGIATFHNSSQFGRHLVISGTCVFNDTSLFYPGALKGIGGAVTFNGTSECRINPIGGIYGSIIFNDSSYSSYRLPGEIGETGTITFNGSSHNDGSINPTTNIPVAFNNSSVNNGTISNTAAGMSPSFHGTSHNSGTIDNGSFYDTSYNASSVLHNASLYDSAYNTGTISGNATVNYPAPRPIGGTVIGTTTYVGYPPPTPTTLYFNGAVSVRSSDIGNWWKDASFTIPAGRSIIDGDTLKVYADITYLESAKINSLEFYGTSSLTSDSAINFTASGYNIPIAFYENSSCLAHEIDSNADVKFYGNSASNSYITANTKFYELSHNDGVLFNSEFYDNSYNNGTISGDANVHYPVARYLGGTVSGTTTYLDYPEVIYWYDGNWWLDSAFTIAGYPPDSYMPVAVYSDIDFIYSYSLAVYGNAVVASGGYTLDIGSGSVSFHDNSVNNASINCDTDGTISFSGSSINNGSASFQYPSDYTIISLSNNAVNNGDLSATTINVYFPSPIPIGGTTSGTINYYGYPSFYFNDQASGAAGDGDWNNVLNWWIDPSFTNHQTSLPDSTSDVAVYSNVSSSSSISVNNFTALSTSVVNLPSGSEINGMADFYGSSSFSGECTFHGETTFHNSSENNGSINASSSSVQISFRDSSSNNGSVTGASCRFYNGAINSNTGSLAYPSYFYNSSYNYASLSEDGNFYDSSVNEGSISGLGYFSNGATNNGSLLTGGSFSNSSINYGTTTNCTFNYPAADRGTSTGATYVGYPTTLYFTDSSSNDWSDLGNWWYNSAFTQPNLIPNVSITTAYVYADVLSNSGSVPTSFNSLIVINGNIGIPLTVSNATFSNASHVTGSISGPCLFLDSSYNNGTISSGTFRSNSYNLNTVSGNGAFFDLSRNSGTIATGQFNNYSLNNESGVVSGNATLKDGSKNRGLISGNADVYWPSEKPIGGSVSGVVTYHGYNPNRINISFTIVDPFVLALTSSIQNPYQTHISSVVYL